jgi:tRNA threonylcarbamoyl adenosine modification protein YeaZ
MTTTLAIDTSTSRTIVGLIVDGKCVEELFHEGATDHGFALSDLVSKVLVRYPQIDSVVVGMGPGPFTGLRVGISFAQSFALAREIPVTGICSLDAIDIKEADYTVAIDARRKEIYWARYENGLRVDGPHVNKPDEVKDFIFDVYPSMEKLVLLARDHNITEPMYLRRPDAVPTAERL